MLYESIAYSVLAELTEFPEMPKSICGGGLDLITAQLEVVRGN